LIDPAGCKIESWLCGVYNCCVLVKFFVSLQEKLDVALCYRLLLSRSQGLYDLIDEVFHLSIFIVIHFIYW